MKKISLLITAALCMALLPACEQENDKGFYDKVDRLYFPKDSLNISLGTILPDVLAYTFEFPVNKMGLPSDRDMSFRISLIEDRTTAEAGVQYAPLQTEYAFPKGTMEAVIPVELLREGIRAFDDDGNPMVYQLAFRIEASDDFEPGALESLSAVLTFNDFLEEPDWWKGMFNGYNSIYHPGMYARIIAYYGYPLDTEDEEHEFPGYLDLLYVFKTQVYDYAMENPELTGNWQFDDDLWWPYE